MARSFVVAGHRLLRLGFPARDGEAGQPVYDLTPGTLVHEAWLEGRNVGRLLKLGMLAEGPQVKDKDVTDRPDGDPVAWTAPEPVENPPAPEPEAPLPQAPILPDGAGIDPTPTAEPETPEAPADGEQGEPAAEPVTEPVENPTE